MKNSQPKWGYQCGCGVIAEAIGTRDQAIKEAEEHKHYDHAGDEYGWNTITSY